MTILSSTSSGNAASEPPRSPRPRPVVTVLTASGCLDCHECIARLRSMAVIWPFDIVEMDYSTKEALDYSIEHELTNIPSFVAGQESFNETNWRNSDVLKALGLA